MPIKDRATYLEYQRKYSLERRGRSRVIARIPKEVLCLCGCGEKLLDWDSSRRREVRYLHGHHGKRKNKEFVQCACGCGEVIERKFNYSTQEYYKFAHGHNIRLATVAPSDGLKGKHPWNYKDGKGSLQPDRKTREYAKWRNAVFQRDRYTCRRCGKSQCYVEAHHILFWSEHVEYRLDPFNGLTLCEECHKKEHKKLRKTE